MPRNPEEPLPFSVLCVVRLFIVIAALSMQIDVLFTPPASRVTKAFRLQTQAGRQVNQDSRGGRQAGIAGSERD